MEHVPESRPAHITEGEQVSEHVKYIHTIVKLSPERYDHTASCHHIVVESKDHVFRTMLTKSEFKDFKKTMKANYGNVAKVSSWWRWNRRLVYIRYAPDHFKIENTLEELQGAIYFLLQHKCNTSHLDVTEFQPIK